MSKLGGSITLLAAIREGLGVVVIDNTGPMMRVGAGQILEDDGPGEGGDAIKIRLAVEWNAKASSLGSCYASLLHVCAVTHALQPGLHIRSVTTYCTRST